MSEVQLPDVGQVYKHKTRGDVVVVEIRKRGRGYQVLSRAADSDIGESGIVKERLAGWNKAIAA